MRYREAPSGVFPLILAAMMWIAGTAGAEVSVSEDTAWYSGSISAEQNRQFFEAVQGRAVKRLVITSDGGEVAAGIALGLWVFENKLDIEVPEYCLSSCANYVFPAGRHKFIGKGAVVAWHGNYHHLEQTGLWEEEVAVRMERHGKDAVTARAQVREEVDRLVHLEQDFFARIGVDEYLCWIGKMPPYSVPDYYFLSKEDMARFGVTHVHTPAGYEKAKYPGVDANVIYIKLNADKKGADHVSH
ncbi:MAG: hypothetical protein JSU75_09330 [Gammaproteobacteria bacterium]|nr:MAG: hypothetical protein JSU75_09330 [Gammaproteobacteria bacterium]